MGNTEVNTAQPVSSAINTIIAQNENVLILVQFKNKELGSLMYNSMGNAADITANGEVFVQPDLLLEAFASASAQVIE